MSGIDKSDAACKHMCHVFAINEEVCNLNQQKNRPSRDPFKLLNYIVKELPFDCS